MSRGISARIEEAELASPGVAKKALEYMSLLYTMEANLRHRGATPEQVVRERQTTGKLIMDGMEKWMWDTHKATPSDLLGKAMDYAYKLWPRMRNYTLDGRYHLDNNDVERGQRLSVLGRKNYLFSQNDRGAEDNAIFYSFIGSCERVSLNPLEWLTDVLDKLRDDMDEDGLVQLLPYQYAKSRDSPGIF